ncbi:MAG: peptidoglycan-binding domain-containing protein [Patescibacteria group bacterium]
MSNRIKKSITTTAVALTTVALIAPAAVGAVTIEELQAQINALLAQLTALQAAQGQPAGMPAACAGVTLSRNLVVGSTGSDVKCLQASMNTLGYTVASSGAGSMGNETTYFGSRTLAAVQKFQVAKFGYSASQVGPLTRAELNAWLGGAPAPTPGPTPTPVPTGAGLTVMLASDNPAGGSVVDASALHPMAKLVFTNGDNAEVKIVGLKLKRIGVAADASITNTYLFKGAERLTDGSAVSSTIVNFNNSAGLFMVPANGSVTISVLSDVDGSASETVGFQIISSADVTSNASSVKGTYPISGNLMTIATATIAGVNFNTSTTPAAASIDPQDGYTVWQNSTTVTTRAVDMTRITFRRTGSVKNQDLQNFKLYVDGVQVGSTQQLVTNTLGEHVVIFDLTSSPKRLEAGTRVIKVLADIIGGSNLTFTMHVWNVADGTFIDSQLGASVLAQSASAAFTKRSTGEQTVNAGTLTITKMTDSPSGDVIDALNNALLAKFQFKAAGEKIKVENLIISAVVSTSGVGSLRNGAVFANGVQVGSTATLNDNGASTASTTYNFGSSLIVEPLSPVTVEVRADIFDNDGTNSIVDGTTIAARLEGASTNNNGTGLISATTLDIPSVDTDGNTLTVKQGSLTISKYTAYTNQTVVAPLTAYKMGHWTLTATTSEAVNLTAINLLPNSVASSNASNLYIKYGNQTSSVKATVGATAANNNWAINYILPAGATIDIMAFADYSSSAAAGTATFDADVDATTASSAVSADITALVGQNIVFSSGSFATAFDGVPQNQAVSGNQSVLAGRFKLTSSYQDYNVKLMRFTANSNPSPIASATLKDSSGTILATVPYNNANSYFEFTGLASKISVPASTSKRIDLYWNLSIPSSTASSWALDTKAALTRVEYEDPSGTVSTDTNTRTGNSTIAYRAIPLLTQVDLNNSSYISNGGELDLYRFTMAAPAQGPIDMKQFKLALTWSDGGTDATLTLHTLKLIKDGVDITGSVTIDNEDAAGTAEGTSGVTEGDSTIIVTWDGSTEDAVAAGTSTTYTIRGTPNNFRTGTGSSDTAGIDSVALVFTRDTAAPASTENYLNADSPAVGSIVGLYTSAAAGNSAATNHTMIWSDEAAVAHAAAVGASSTGDWTNSYLVQNILTSETWSR